MQTDPFYSRRRKILPNNSDKGLDPPILFGMQPPHRFRRCYGWLRYLTGIKDALGNLSNDIPSVATLLAKACIAERFGIMNFDAAGKPQGASDIDIEARPTDGKIIVGELKTTMLGLGYGPIPPWPMVLNRSGVGAIAAL